MHEGPMHLTPKDVCQSSSDTTSQHSTLGEPWSIIRHQRTRSPPGWTGLVRATQIGWSGKLITYTYRYRLHLAMGQKPGPPVNIPIPAKIGSKMGGTLAFDPQPFVFQKPHERQARPDLRACHRFAPSSSAQSRKDWRQAQELVAGQNWGLFPENPPF